jgi:hypothetical protein
LFFFVGEDFKRLRQGATNTWLVPTPAQIAGDFSALPSSSWPKDPNTGAVFPGGIIPANRISQNSQRLLQNYPAPNFNGSGGNYVFNTVSPLNTNQYIYKVDYNLSSRNQISGHYTRDYYTSTQNLTRLIEYNRDIPGTNAAVQWTFVANPSTVNVLQGAFTGNVILEKTGIDIKRSRKNQDNVPAINGTFAFSTSDIHSSGNATADAVLGNFYTYTEASGLRQGWYASPKWSPIFRMTGRCRAASQLILDCAINTCRHNTAL